jgi:nucleotide-binding universal stress UspA family protein
MQDLPVVRELIVVGLDHTPAGTAALRWAVDEGTRSGARVMAVHVYDRNGRADLAAERDHESEKSKERIEAHRQLVDALGDEAARLGIAISQVEGPVATRLAEATRHAALLVLGRPSDPAHKALPQVLPRLCRCPVVVIDEAGQVERLECDSSGLPV